MKTTSFSLSQRLQVLGVKQESAFYWVEYRKWESIDGKMVEQPTIWKIEPWGTLCGDGHATGIHIPAYLAEELAEMLPLNIHYYRVQGGFVCEEIDGKQMGLTRDTLSEALGEFLAYLLQEGLISNEK